MQTIKMGILGAGVIARAMAKTIQQMPGVEPCAVAARDEMRAGRFAQEFGFERAYGSYEAMMADDAVQLVYIATPHSHHAAHAKLCIAHGKAVLCEKPLTANALQAEEVFAFAREKGVFITEAMWTRFMPLAHTLRRLVDDGVVGPVHCLTANLGGARSSLPRMYDPALAGGALLDLGIYPLTFAAIAFGTDVESMVSSAVLTDRGVDAQNAVVLRYKNGRMANLFSTMVAESDHCGVLCGEEGRLVVDEVTNFKHITAYDKDGKRTHVYERPDQITGYEYEVEACVAALRDGRLECPEIPHAETLRMMRLMDSLRHEWGVRYPFE